MGPAADDSELLAQTVHAHIERLRANVLARLENAGSLLPVADPLAAVTRPQAPPETVDGY